MLLKLTKVEDTDLEDTDFTIDPNGTSILIDRVHNEVVFNYMDLEEIVISFDVLKEIIEKINNEA